MTTQHDDTNVGKINNVMCAAATQDQNIEVELNGNISTVYDTNNNDRNNENYADDENDF